MFVLKTRVKEATELHLNKAGNAVERNNEARLCSHYCYRKATSISYFACLSLALDIQDAVCMRIIVVCDRLAVRYFFTLSDERYDFRKKKIIGHKICFVFSTIFF